MEQSDTILQVEGLTVRFQVGKRQVHAVNGADFVLRRGKMLAIVGESGCGKSATAHAILQLLPKNGRITGGAVDYFPPEGAPQRLTALAKNSRELRTVRGAGIAMIFQDPLASLNPVYTVGRQIEENLRAHEKISPAHARARAIELLAGLGIPQPETRVDEYPHQFSGGMKQRVMIAIAMACNPRILIADEPTTALDVTIQAQILALMQQLQKERGMSVLLITHNMGIVAETCDDVAVMYMGTVVECGTLRQVFETPLHPYTRALMDSVPVPGMDPDKPLPTIPGAAPDGFSPFTGCPFAARCGKAMAVCATAPPAECTLEPGHRVRCHLYAKGVDGA